MIITRRELSEMIREEIASRFGTQLSEEDLEGDELSPGEPLPPEGVPSDKNKPEGTPGSSMDSFDYIKSSIDSFSRLGDKEALRRIANFIGALTDQKAAERMKGGM
jgi:hypothetical protein